jgi:hypothetical protein
MVVVSRETFRRQREAGSALATLLWKGKRPSIGRLTPNDRISKNLLARSSGS